MKITIDGIEKSVTNASELKEVLKSKGVADKNLSDQEASYLPAGEVTFIDYEINEFTPEGETAPKVNIVMLAKQGKDTFKCSLGKLTAFGTIATPEIAAESIELATSANGNKYVPGESVNSFIPSGKHLAVYSLLNKKFNVTPVDIFQLKFGTEQVVARGTYKLTHA